MHLGRWVKSSDNAPVHSLRIVVCMAMAAVFSDDLRAEGDSTWIVEYDASKSIQPEDAKWLSNVSEVNHTPLFANVPFVHLRPGDKLVSAVEPSKGTPRQAYCVLSHGKYCEFEAREEHGKLLLADDWLRRDPVLFHWEFTLPHATVLSKLVRSEANEVNLHQYVDICGSMQKRFPGMECRSPSSIDLVKDRVLPAPSPQVAEFQGIAYNSALNRLERYSLKIGPDTCTMKAEVLIQGPPRVERYEFDEEYVRKNNESPSLNGTFYRMPDPEAAKQKRAEYREWLAFQTIILDVIAPNRVRSLEEMEIVNSLPDAAGKIPAAHLDLQSP
jgi:hypothetical protein